MPERDAAKLVFIDESGFNTKMTRLYGRSARGERCVEHVPHGRWEASTFIAGLRLDRVDAPMLLEGAMNGDAFEVYVRDVLAPTLAPGDVVICDNLNVHKNHAAREAIEARGATLEFLPRYSPDMNPIEQLFSKLKAVVRRAMPECFDEICAALKEALAAVTIHECANYLSNAGYGPT